MANDRAAMNMFSEAHSAVHQMFLTVVCFSCQPNQIQYILQLIWNKYPTYLTPLKNPRETVKALQEVLHVLCPLCWCNHYLLRCEPWKARDIVHLSFSRNVGNEINLFFSEPYFTHNSLRPLSIRAVKQCRSRTTTSVSYKKTIICLQPLWTAHHQ